MIAFDTNALIRILIEDDAEQAQAVEEIILQVEADGGQILILSEVLIEAVWVLEGVYRCTREEVAGFIERLAHTPVFVVDEPLVIRKSVSQYKKGGDFADCVIVHQAMRLNAEKLISFDKKLQQRFPAFVKQD